MAVGDFLSLESPLPSPSSEEELEVCTDGMSKLTGPSRFLKDERLVATRQKKMPHIDMSTNF